MLVIIQGPVTAGVVAVFFPLLLSGDAASAVV